MKNSLQLAAAPLSLAALDGLAVPDLVAFVSSDERPLRGLAGFADWRLCGELTRQVKAGRFTGRLGDALLTVSAGRLPVQRIFLFGIGPAASVRTDFFLADALAAVARAGGSAIGTALPGRALLGERAAALADAARAAGLRQVVLLHDDEQAAARALGLSAATIVGLPVA